MSALPDEGRCSAVSARLGEPLAGSAPLARAWLVLEQPGPYGRQALTESHLPAEVGAAVSRAAEGTRVTVLLARRPGHHADDRAGGSTRRFWFAHCAAGGTRMRSGVLDDSVLLRPDLPDVLRDASRGQLPPWGARDDAPLLLVCTNSRRDRCCAIEGRPLAAELAQGPHGDRVLEANHLGGHRFAPTALLLPSGFLYGRLDAAAGAQILAEAQEGRLAALDRLRGRSSAAAPAQAAAIAVRREAGAVGVDDVDVLHQVGEHHVPVPLGLAPDADEVRLEVRHVDGRTWDVLVRREAVAADRPESCGKAAVPARAWRAVEVAAAAPWA
jgi:hypothetical protein